MAGLYYTTFHSNEMDEIYMTYGADYAPESFTGNPIFGHADVICFSGQISSNSSFCPLILYDTFTTYLCFSHENWITRETA